MTKWPVKERANTKTAKWSRKGNQREDGGGGEYFLRKEDPGHGQVRARSRGMLSMRYRKQPGRDPSSDTGVWTEAGTKLVIQGRLPMDTN